LLLFYYLLLNTIVLVVVSLLVSSLIVSLAVSLAVSSSVSLIIIIIIITMTIPKRYTITDLIQGLIIGASIALFITNIYHIMKKCEKKTPNILENHLESLSYRLILSENIINNNKKNINILLYNIQKNIKYIDNNIMNNIIYYSENEAIRIALLLEKMPSIPMPYYESSYSNSNNYKYEDIYESKYNFTDDFFFTNRSSRTDDKEWGAKESYFEYGYEKDKQDKISEPLLSDVEAHKICSEWKETYQVQVGVGWGLLPFDLQKKWLEYSCDYHLN
jgi:hypothetical protein